MSEYYKFFEMDNDITDILGIINDEDRVLVKMKGMEDTYIVYLKDRHGNLYSTGFYAKDYNNIFVDFLSSMDVSQIERFLGPDCETIPFPKSSGE
ncbi:MAG TPA: hypothetical protein ENN72_05820 [Firmicutes bacterium]|nr:hypothetical protein [Bacillota bacterium]